MDNRPAEKERNTLATVTVMLSVIALGGALTYAFHLASGPAFSDMGGVARWLTRTLGPAGLVCLWFYLILEPLASRLPAKRAGDRQLHQLLGLLAVALVVIEPIALAVTGEWSLLFGTNEPGSMPFILLYRLAALLLIGWTVLVAVKRCEGNRVPALVNALMYLAFFCAMLYWRIAGGIQQFGTGKYVWYAFAVSFSVLVGWRLIPGESNEREGGLANQDKK